MDPADLLKRKSQIQGIKAYNASTCAIVLWEMLVLWRQEYRRIWRADWSWVKGLFFLVRYGNILSISLITAGFWSTGMSSETCRIYAPFEPASAIIPIGAAEAILAIRVWALYGKSKWIIWPLVALLIIELAVMAASSAFYVPVEFPPEMQEYGCIATGNGAISAGFWIAPLVYDSIIMALTLWKMAETKTRARSHLTQLFFRDGILYFLVIFAVNLLNTVFYLATSQDIQAINSSLAVGLTGVMGARIVLSLRTGDGIAGGGSSTSRDRSHSHRSPGPNTTIGGTQHGNSTFKMSDFGGTVFEDEYAARARLSAVPAGGGDSLVSASSSAVLEDDESSIGGYGNQAPTGQRVRIQVTTERTVEG